MAKQLCSSYIPISPDALTDRLLNDELVCYIKTDLHSPTHKVNTDFFVNTVKLVKKHRELLPWCHEVLDFGLVRRGRYVFPIIKIWFRDANEECDRVLAFAVDPDYPMPDNFTA